MTSADKVTVILGALFLLTICVVAAVSNYSTMRVNIEKVWAANQYEYECECITDECVEAEWYASTTINN